MRHPDPSEYAPYYSRYVDLVSSDNVIDTLETQLSETKRFLQTISSDKSLHRYAPDKWTIREVLSHVNDTERVFAFRALSFARKRPEPLPSFDQDPVVSAAAANDVAWVDLVDDFYSVRKASISLFKTLPANAWTYTGIASDNPFSVRALAYIIAGHVIHHCAVMKDRYL